MSLLETFFGWVCHQIPARSPHTTTSVFPLCYRCAGLYLGIFAGYAGLFLGGGWRRRSASTRRLILLGMLMIPFLVDGWANTLALWDSPGWIRAATGLATGIMLASVLWPLTMSGHVATRSGRPPAGRALDVAAATGFGTVLLFLLEGSGAYYLPLAAAAAAGLALLAVNLVATARALHRRDLPAAADAERPAGVEGRTARDAVLHLRWCVFRRDVESGA